MNIINKFVIINYYLYLNINNYIKSIKKNKLIYLIYQDITSFYLIQHL